MFKASQKGTYGFIAYDLLLLEKGFFANWSRAKFNFIYLRSHYQTQSPLLQVTTYKLLPVLLQVCRTPAYQAPAHNSFNDHSPRSWHQTHRLNYLNGTVCSYTWSIPNDAGHNATDRVPFSPDSINRSYHLFCILWIGAPDNVIFYLQDKQNEVKKVTRRTLGKW